IAATGFTRITPTVWRLGTPVPFRTNLHNHLPNTGLNLIGNQDLCRCYHSRPVKISINTSFQVKFSALLIAAILVTENARNPIRPAALSHGLLPARWRVRNLKVDGLGGRAEHAGGGHDRPRQPVRSSAVLQYGQSQGRPPGPRVRS